MSRLMTCHQPGLSMWPRWWRGEAPSCLRTFLSRLLLHQVRNGGRVSCSSLFRGNNHFCYFSTVPPPEERNRLWMVEAEISPEMIKRKKKKKRKKEVSPVAEPGPVVERQAYQQREFGRSSVPHLPKLPCHPSLVANLWEQQRMQQQMEEEVLPGSYPEFQCSYPPSCEERRRYPPYQSKWSGYDRSVLSDPILADRPEDLGLGPCCPPSASTWQRYPGEASLPDGLSERMARLARVPAGRRTGFGPVHSRTSLMEAELMDADSDFWEQFPCGTQTVSDQSAGYFLNSY